MSKKWYVYILICGDNTLYTGITTDLNRRLQEHRSGKGAKYTKSRGVKGLVTYFEGPDRSWASKLEASIKKLPRKLKYEIKNEDWLDKHIDFSNFSISLKGE